MIEEQRGSLHRMIHLDCFQFPTFPHPREGNIGIIRRWFKQIDEWCARESRFQTSNVGIINTKKRRWCFDGGFLHKLTYHFLLATCLSSLLVSGFLAPRLCRKFANPSFPPNHARQGKTRLIGEDLKSKKVTKIIAFASTLARKTR